MTEPYIGTNNMLTQGFVQPEPPMITVNMNQYQSFDERVFPNPVTDNLFIQLNLPASADITIEVVDVLGKKQSVEIIKHEMVGKSSYQLNMEKFDAGIYFVHVISSDSQLNKTFKINKN